MATIYANVQTMGLLVKDVVVRAEQLIRCVARYHDLVFLRVALP